MIEVEKKIALTNEENIARLTQGATFLREVKNEDVYYDNSTFDLTTKDWWLRTRDGKFELKIPLHKEKGSDRFADQYDELEDNEKIRQALGLHEGNLAGVLAKAGYAPFSSIKTIRQKYKKGSFTIDIDLADFGEATYRVGEIELMVNDQSEIPNALRKIAQFVQEHKLQIVSVRGKVLEFIKRYRPEHYQSLQKAGVAKK